MTVPQFSFLKTQCYYWNTKQKHLLSSTKIPSDWLKTIGAPTTAGMGYVIVSWNPTVFFELRIRYKIIAVASILHLISFGSLVLWLVTFFLDITGQFSRSFSKKNMLDHGTTTAHLGHDDQWYPHKSRHLFFGARQPMGKPWPQASGVLQSFDLI